MHVRAVVLIIKPIASVFLSCRCRRRSCLSSLFPFRGLTISVIIIHCSHHLSSHWLKAYSSFWETVQPTDYSLICRYRLVNNLQVARAMHDFLYKDGENLSITQLYIFKCLKINCDRCDFAFVVIFFKTMYNNTIIRFGFV